MMRAMSQHGAVIPQPESIHPLATVNIMITARSFSFSPASFTVNQGDVVMITATVPGSDQSRVGHGILMETYIEDGLDIPRGGTVMRTFTATTPGMFAWVCTQPSCGDGHTSMFGRMIVNAAAQGPQITSISPNTGPTSGGTPITISGSGFQSGATVTIGGIAATNVNVSSSTTITATTPLGPATQQLISDLVVTNPDGTKATLSGGFTWTVPSLAVTTVSPASGPPGTLVTITGAGFTTAVTSSVTFGGIPAANVTIVNPITIRAVAPAHALGAVDVSVTIGGSTVVKSGSFTYQAIPPRRRAASH
jgi:plastocyanin